MGWMSNYCQQFKILAQYVKNRTQERYYGVVPYDWRPPQIVYFLKCKFWTKPTTIKPRTLKHGYCDKTELLPYLMFECLTQFIETECSPGPVAWYSSWPGNKFNHQWNTIQNGKQKYAMDELLDLYYWWSMVYLKEYPEVEKILWNEINNNEPIHYGKGKYWTPTFNCDTKKDVWKRCMKALNKLDEIMFAELTNRMKRLSDVRGFMWT